MCYLVTIPEFGDGVTFHIVKKNFQVEVGAENVFESEAGVGNPPPPPPVDGERASGRNVFYCLKCLSELCSQFVTVFK